MAHIALRTVTPVTEILLPAGKIWRADGDLRGEVIRCEKGSLWITQHGDLNDYLLNSGDRFWVTRPGTLLVQAVRDARFNSTRDKPIKLEPRYAHLGHD